MRHQGMLVTGRGAMRAGCFAETRVIQLLNRRFVSFYYNTGGPGLGKDPAAAAFIKGKAKNTFAFYAAFTAGGEPLGVTDVYADKDNTFDFLVALLRENPDLRPLHEGGRSDPRAGRRPSRPTPAARLAAGRLLEDLGRYKEAEPHYRAVLAGKARSRAAADGAIAACCGWPATAATWERLELLARRSRPPPARRELWTGGRRGDGAGFRLLAEKKYAGRAHTAGGGDQAAPRLEAA